MGGENNNNRAEDSLHFHEGLGTNAMKVTSVIEVAGLFILPSRHMIILPIETNKNTLGVTLGGNPYQPRLP
jgi:hypothetical protein